MSNSRINPLPLQKLGTEERASMADGEAMMGFIANDCLTMARVPGLLSALFDLAQACYRPGRVDLETKRLVAYMTSSAAGCLYCQNHNLYGSLRVGIAPSKREGIWDYPESAEFTEAQRSALRVAHHAALNPNQVSDEDFAHLREHYSEDECAELVAVMSLFGFLNRWNDTVRTQPEDLSGLIANKD